MTVAVTGASGIVGQFLIKRLHSEDRHVVAISRNSTSLITPRTPLIEWRKANFLQPDRLADALAGCDSLVHCAFDHLPGKYRGGEGDDPEGFWRRNFFGTMNVLNMARQVGVARTVFVSSRAVFGEHSPYGDISAAIADSERVFPDSHYGALKAAIESLQLLYTDIGMCSIRPTGVFGLIEPNNATKWWELVKESQDNPDESHCSVRPRTEVHGDDVAVAILVLLEAESEDVCGRVFNCSDITVNEVLIRRVAYRMANGIPDPLSNPLPDMVEAHHAIACDGLKHLGWEPGGMRKFVSTIGEILDLQKRE